MTMGRIWTAMAVLAVVCGLATGRMDAVGTALLEGAGAAVELSLSMLGALCLWSGILEVMSRAGLSAGLTRLLRPLLRRLYPDFADDRAVMDAVSANLSANLLGLGSAATPSGLRAAKRLRELSDRKGVPPHGVFLLIVLNTASLQLLPTTVAAVRAGLGAAQPYDILPAVWLSSAVSVTVGMVAARLMRGGGRL